MKTLLALTFTLLMIQTAHSAPITCADSQALQDTIQDTTVGNGAMAISGKDLTVHYVGTLCNGKVFDSSVARNQPFTFKLGAGQVIAGWEQGFNNMQVGGKRRIVIPAALAYGAHAVGGIPANSILVFDIELLDVK